MKIMTKKLYKYLIAEMEALKKAIDMSGTSNADKLQMEAQIIQIQIVLKDFPLKTK